MPAPTAFDTTHWSAPKRFVFRFAFAYLIIYVLAGSGIINVLPVVGPPVQSAAAAIWQVPAQWIAQHWLHLQGVAATWHATDSRDEALDWIVTVLFLSTALLSSIVWSLLDRRRQEYRTAAVWLRFVLRLTLVFLLCRYGLMKAFPLQMSRPSLAVLNEPLGNTSPMTLLWTMIGLHPAYQMLCGVIELACATLLFFRRTALAGALLTVFVMTNVLLYNLFFDVPVKLGAANLLLLAVAVVMPDLRALGSFFWSHQPSAPTAAWVPPSKQRTHFFVLRSCEILLLALTLLFFVPIFFRNWSTESANLRHPSPLTGEWHVESARFTKNGQATNLPVLTGEGRPMIDLYLEPDGRVMARSNDGKLWRAQSSVNLQQNTMQLNSGYFDGERFNAAYRFQQPDANHLILTPVGQQVATNATLSLTRVPIPAQYPLLQHSVHLVNEWALER